MSDIIIKGARMHNLRGIDVTIPRNSLTVITGLSGSGKSSLAFDTLYAEGQRRYVESLSAYARQFLDRLAKPDVEKIEGLSPAISIEQHTTSGNPRSIVATVTEIHDYLRILYGSIATAHCPKCGKPVTRQSAEQIVDAILALSPAPSTNHQPTTNNHQPTTNSPQPTTTNHQPTTNSPQPTTNNHQPTTKLLLLAPLVKGKKGRHEEVFATLKRNGFARVRVDGEQCLLEEVPALDKKKNHSIDVIVDRLVLPREGEEASQVAAFRTRLTDSVELALKTGHGVMMVEVLGERRETGDSLPSTTNHQPPTNNQLPSTTNHQPPTNNQFHSTNNQQPPTTNQLLFSELNACPDCGLSFDELKPRSFSFNSPFGACPTCGGLGRLYYFDEDLVVPDKTLPLRECIHPWRRCGHNAIMYYNALLEQIAKQYKVKLSTPYEDLPTDFRKGLMHGFKDDLILPWRSVDRPFEGVLATLKRHLDEAEDDETRAKWEAYQSEKTCPDCQGARLRPESRAATIAGKTIVEVMAMPIEEARKFFETLTQDARRETRDAASGLLSHVSRQKLAGLKDILNEIIRRLQFLLDVGLDYLTLDRASATLSGGEMQRIRLATQIGSGLTGVLYVLDEPTIGLHPRDNERLIASLKGLRDRGNTVVIVEHDAEMMRAADHIIDLGPGAGREGGRLMYQGNYKGLLKARSLTADYLTGRKKVSPPNQQPTTNNPQPTTPNPQPPTNNQQPTTNLTLSGCTEHNLKNITVHIPLGSFTVVTGVSGSGKSTLIDETLKRALMRHFYRAKAVPGKYRKLTGLDRLDKVIEIDQSPIGRTPRSNPATYVGFFSDIRELFAQTEAAKARGYTPGRFSFNVKGGRCEVCGGDGLTKLEMSFLPDVYVTCEQCGGKRFNAETLEVTYRGKNIAEVLEMTVAEACEFFDKVPSLRRKLQTLADVGLGYIALGQSSTTLSGGEAQRIKLATELSRRATGRTLYLLDEPTTGLHFDDVAKLMKILLKLRDQGNTVVVIEHNVDVMASADWIIDLGPGGGDRGGHLVCEGPVDAIRACPDSVTGRFLKEAKS